MYYAISHVPLDPYSSCSRFVSLVPVVELLWVSEALLQAGIHCVGAYDFKFYFFAYDTYGEESN